MHQIVSSFAILVLYQALVRIANVLANALAILVCQFQPNFWALVRNIQNFGIPIFVSVNNGCSFTKENTFVIHGEVVF